MANIGTFTAQDKDYTGTVHTLTLNVKVKIVPVTLYARLIEGEEGNYDLIWLRPS